MNVTIIGIGLIGGSLAIDMRRRGIAEHIFGVDNNPDNAIQAKALGLVDEIVDLQTGVEKADVVVLSVPVDAAVYLAPKVLDMIDSQVVFDTTSVKLPLIKTIASHPKRKNFVAVHPMAGTEYSGPQAAQAGLFDNKTLIICDAESSDKKSIAVVEDVFGKFNMRIIQMDAYSHDVHAAYVSHISHISSFALALSVLYKEKDEKNIFDMAGGGFASTVRLAKSAASMWVPIFLQNKQNVLEVLDTYINFLYDFKLAIFNDDRQRLEILIKRANKVRDILETSMEQNSMHKEKIKIS